MKGKRASGATHSRMVMVHPRSRSFAMQASFLVACFQIIRRKSADPPFRTLKDLQNHLGALNDIQVHQKLVPKLASGKPRTKSRQRVFAVGVVSGREQSEIEPLLNLAAKDASKFAQTQPFWT